MSIKQHFIGPLQQLWRPPKGFRPPAEDPGCYCNIVIIKIVSNFVISGNLLDAFCEQIPWKNYCKAFWIAQY